MTGTATCSITIPVRPWFVDHNFFGRIIFPAVESLQLLAEHVADRYPTVNVRQMSDCRLGKLLPLDPGQKQIAAEIIIDELDNHTVRASVSSWRQFPAFRRLVEHCRVTFGSPNTVPDGADRPCSADMPGYKTIACEQVYQELVPFGSAYQTLQGELQLGSDWARGILCTRMVATSALLGSPFPLDGAMHAACVHGQHRANYIPFPVGFASRQVAEPTLSGGQYLVLVRRRPDSLPDCCLYDLVISDLARRIRETVQGLRMQDISGGQHRPPTWLTREPLP